MSEENSRIVLAYVDAFNRGDLEALCALFTPDAQIHGVLGWGGKEVVKPIWHDLTHCLQIPLQVDAIISEGNTITVRYTERGKAVQPFRGLPATGRTYELVALEWFEVKNGLIHRRWAARDSARQARQLGWS